MHPAHHRHRRVDPRAGGGYEVDDALHQGQAVPRDVPQTFTADQVVFSAAALGTQRLLHRMKDEGHLPQVSRPARRTCSRTNSESILGRDRAHDDAVDYTEGVAITSSFHPDEHTHIEPVRYGPGRNVMSLMQTVLTDGVADEPRWRTWLQGDVDAARATSRPLRHRTLVGAHRDRAGHAEPRQLDHDRRQAQPLTGRLHMTSRAGPRRCPTRPGSPRPRGRTPDGRRSSPAPPAAASASRSTCR